MEDDVGRGDCTANGNVKGNIACSRKNWPQVYFLEAAFGPCPG